VLGESISPFDQRRHCAYPGGRSPWYDDLLVSFKTKGLFDRREDVWCCATRAGWLRSNLGLRLVFAQYSASIRLDIVVRIDPARDQQPQRGLAAEVSGGRKRVADI
jgi:hypothetical protein